MEDTLNATESVSLASFASIYDYISWEKRNFYSQMFPLSGKYALVEPKYIIAAPIIYALILIWGLSRKIADKKPLINDGRWALRIYNAFQVALSLYISYLAFVTYSSKILFQGFVCQPMKVSIEKDPEEYDLETYTCWLFYISKWVDYIDTVFIIARSKWRQLSFLHTFHHSTMIIMTWTATHYHPCGYFLATAQLNSGVHVIMYFYYLLSSFPGMAPYLWWKNYITTIQLLQFVTGCVISIFCLCKQALGYTTGLSYFFVTGFILYCILLFSMFSAFYRSTYTQKKKKTTKPTVDNSTKSKKDL